MTANLFPTHVGMDRMDTSAQAATLACSPRTWGWTAGRAGPRALRALFPTHVGMDRAAPTSAKRHIQLFPTHVGMDRDKGRVSRSSICCSPRTWGWTE